MPYEELPFWLVNVPKDQWPAECPEFLRVCSEKDQKIIGIPDEQYELLKWDEVREIVSTDARALSDEMGSDTCW
jgi:hypothetical protein